LDGGLQPLKMVNYIFCNYDSCNKKQRDLKGDKSTWYSRLTALKAFYGKHPRKELKELVDNNEIKIDIASSIASVKDPATQNTLIELAKTKDRKELKRELEKHNIETRYKEFTTKDKTQKPHTTEEQLVNKVISRLNEWSAHFDTIIKIIEYDEKFLGKFTPENQLKIMDRLKPLVRKAKHFDTLADKLLIKISEGKK
jgi:hypothetical protein